MWHLEISPGSILTLPHFHRSIPRPQKPGRPVLRRSAGSFPGIHTWTLEWSKWASISSKTKKGGLDPMMHIWPKICLAMVFVDATYCVADGHLRNLWWSPEMGLFFRKLYDFPCVFLGIFVTSANLAPGGYIKNISLSITFTWIQW